MVWCILLPPAPGPEHLTRKWNWVSPIHPTCVCVCTGRKIEREEGSKVEEEEEGKLRREREGEGREHKTPKVQSRLLPHTQLPLGTHQSWSREMRGNRCYSSPCLTAGSRLATPSARRGANYRRAMWTNHVPCAAIVSIRLWYHMQLSLASGCDITCSYR